VKVLDFGLAKAMEPAGATSVDVSMSPTITTPAMTQAGIILGTAAYMSPEQAKGRQADKRSDIWAFGSVLYEMLTGRRAFEGEDISETLAFVLTKPPDWSALPPRTPGAIRTLLRRCLEKDRRRRLADAADARLEIDDAVAALDHVSVEPDSIATARPPFWRRPVAAAMAGLLLGALVAGAAIWQLRSVPSAVGVTRFRYQLPEGQALFEFGSPILAISPDGTQIVYAANRRFYLRAMSAVEAVPIRGTETPQGQLRAPVFSPDGRSIAFAVRLSSGGSIRRVLVAGGTAVSICDGCDAIGPMQWDQSGIVFLSASASPRRLMRVSPDGGRPDVLATLSEDGIFSAAQLLPDGDHALFTVLPGKREFAEARATDWDQSQIVVQSLKSGERKVLIEGGVAAGISGSTTGPGEQPCGN
jgi:serine/threonine-protein kinase